MPMLPMPSPSVRAAGIVAIIGSLLLLLVPLAGLFFLAGPYVGYTPAMGVTLVSSTGVAVLGFSTGMGLLRLKSWARASALGLAGTVSVASAFSLLLALAAHPRGVPGILFFLSVLFMESVPLGISIWWLILFSRKDIAAQFAGQAR